MVEIIPKPTQKIPDWPKALFYVSLALLILVVCLYLVLSYFEQKSVQTLGDLEGSILQISTPKEKVLEVELFSKEQRIKDFAVILSGYHRSANFFQFLESITHPQIWFSKFGLDLEQKVASLSGQAADFKTVGQQLRVFRDQNLIKEVNLTQLSLSEEGGAKFMFSLSLDPQVFR